MHRYRNVRHIIQRFHNVETENETTFDFNEQTGNANVYRLFSDLLRCFTDLGRVEDFISYHISILHFTR